jgi:hypothetical protein
MAQDSDSEPRGLDRDEEAQAVRFTAEVLAGISAGLGSTLLMLGCAWLLSRWSETPFAWTDAMSGWPLAAGALALWAWPPHSRTWATASILTVGVLPAALMVARTRTSPDPAHDGMPPIAVLAL